MNSKLKGILKYSVFIAIGASLFYLAFKDIKWSDFAENLSKAHYEYILLSMAMGFLAFISRGIRWTYLLEPLGFKVNTWRAIHAISMGYFMNMIIPRAGEVARCTTLNQTDKVPIDKLIGTVIIERVIDFIMLALLICLTLFLEYDNILAFFEETSKDAQDTEGISWKTIALIVMALFLAILYFLRGRIRKHKFYQKIKDFALGLVEGLKSISKLEHKWFFIGHTLLIWLMYFLMSYVVVFALDSTSHIDPSSGLFVMIVGAFGIIAPSPGGAGSYHFLAKTGMVVIGIGEIDALTFATMVHTGQTLMTFFAGMIALYVAYKARKKIKALSSK